MKKFAALILAVLMLATMAPGAFAANVDDKSPTVSPSASTANVNDKAPVAGNSAKIPPAGLEEMVLKWRAYNSDTIGWINIPDTKINNPIMWYPGDSNQYYFRRNEEKKYDFNGCYYADFRCDYGNYTLPQITTIYGQSVGKDGSKAVRFDQLRKFLDDDFAAGHPYIYFSDGNKTYTFKVFAVFYADITDVDFPYNVPNLDAKTQQKVIDKAASLSVRDYSGKPGPISKLLTLSTGAYSLTDGTELSYPNNYRFAVMAYAVVNPNSSGK